MNSKLSIIILLTLATMDIISQVYADRDTIGKKRAIEFVNESTRNAKHRLAKYENKKLVTDSSTALKIAEIILFKTYGEKEIQKQRPYEVFLISNYWYIRGTREKVEPGTRLGGGQFNIIIDSFDSKVVLISQDE